MVKTLAKIIRGSFSRIQFTPDLLPGDILGVSNRGPKGRSIWDNYQHFSPSMRQYSVMG